MKKSLLRLSTIALLVFGSLSTIESCKSKPKDADIQAAIATQASSYPGLAATVNDGVATLSGTTSDEAMKSNFEAAVKSVDGVKSVVNNITVTQPEPAAVETAADDTLTKGVTDATKDFPGVKFTINDGVITLTGELKRSQLPTLMQSLNTLKPKKIENKLTLK